jgi:hypothetical protein
MGLLEIDIRAGLLSRKCGSLDVSHPDWHPWPVREIALSFLPNVPKPNVTCSVMSSEFIT